MLAWEVYHQIQRQGWELVQALRPLPTTAREREALFIRLDWLTVYLPALLEQWQGGDTAPEKETAYRNASYSR